MVFHEAPHRLRQTLADMVELLGDRPAALCRELTKLHEDTVRTTLAQAAAFYRDNEPRGEYVLVVAGREKQNLPALTLEEGAARVLALRDGGMKLKEAVRRVADDTGLPRNALYDTALKHKTKKTVPPQWAALFFLVFRSFAARACTWHRRSYRGTWICPCSRRRTRIPHGRGAARCRRPPR